MKSEMHKDKQWTQNMVKLLVAFWFGSSQVNPLCWAYRAQVKLPPIQVVALLEDNEADQVTSEGHVDH